ncbi:MAG: DMT family transporter [Kiritimatiellales bacterium]|nr:DMT family transporter [Pontiella sp.]NNJ69678.1 DMT family transporter [Kiritimatiellales bacterium]
MPVYLLLGLVAAVGYSMGGLFTKQSMAEGCGLFRATAVSMWATALLLLPFLFAGGEPIPWDLWYQPVVAAILFFSGSLFFVLALRTGDLSIVAPLSGVKPLLNALFVSALLGVHVPPGTWAACGLAAIALLVIRTPNVSTVHSFPRTAAMTLGSAVSFALCDTCLQQWAREWVVLRFASITFGLAALASLVLIPRFSTPWVQLSRKAKTHVLTAAAFSALTALCMAFALGHYGHAPEVNIAYSTRSVMSILVAWGLGRFIGGREHHVSRAVLLRRLAGTAILMAALSLVIFGSAS